MVQQDYNMNNRRGFLKSLAILAAASVVPDIQPEKIVISTTSNADQMIGVASVERMRITSSGHIMIHTTGNVGMANLNPNRTLNI